MLKLLAKFFLILITLLAIVHLYFSSQQKAAANITYGLTYSPKYAKYLGLDEKKTYLAILDELQVKNLRLPTYWNTIEKQPSNFDFQEVDFLVEQAAKRDVKILLVVGLRQPRWPECYSPDWTKKLSSNDKNAALLNFVKTTVERYKDKSNIWGFQVENEPTLATFGENCPVPNLPFLNQEVSLVRKLAPNKKIVLTDAGEISAWTPEMALSDVFGTSVYRTVYDKWLGKTNYPLPPYFYQRKSQLVRKLTAPKNQKTIISELQTEPWLTVGAVEVSSDEQAKIFPVEIMNQNLNFAKLTGFDQIYLWGVEWWYFMDKNNHPEYLNNAKRIFSLSLSLVLPKDIF